MDINKLEAAGLVWFQRRAYKLIKEQVNKGKTETQEAAMKQTDLGKLRNVSHHIKTGAEIVRIVDVLG